MATGRLCCGGGRGSWLLAGCAVVWGGAHVALVHRILYAMHIQYSGS